MHHTLHLLGLSHIGYLDNAFDNVEFLVILEKEIYYLRIGVKCEG